MSADRARAGRKALGSKPRGPVPSANRAYRDAMAIGAEMDAVLEADGAVVAEMAALFT
ncbi:MAG: hypothetical protein H6734_11945 [Alphaproteobacteria bacterium]|nr:hypothetical protein [Alphaproteobacteria bacterium]